MHNSNLKIVFMGTPEFATGSLSRLIEHGYNIVAVVTTTDKPSGRGLKTNISDVKRYALEQGLKVLQPVSLKDPSFVEQLRALNADLFIVVAFRMLPQIIWEMPRLGTFNLHASLLPQYRGAAPINWTIINGEKRGGVTTFMLDREIDTGSIILQEALDIDPEETAGTLHDKLKDKGADLVLKTVKLIETGDVQTVPQSEINIGQDELRVAPKIYKEVCRINWSHPVLSIDRLIRGLSPYPAAFSTLKGEMSESDVKIFRCSLLKEVINDNLPTGSILSDNKSYLYVRCADNYLSLEQIQVAGKKRLNIREFLAGFRNITQYHFD